MRCTGCRIFKAKEEFHTNSSMCKQCKQEWAISTVERFAGTRYSMLLTRSKQCDYKTLGFTKLGFIEWSESNGLPELLKTYKDRGMDVMLRPEIDRIDPNEGYIVGNVQWLTHEEHRAKSAKEKRGQVAVDLFNIRGEFIKSLDSLLDAATFLGESNAGNVANALNYGGAVAGTIPCHKGCTPDQDVINNCRMTKKAKYWLYN